MNALLAFQFEETPIRVVMIDGEPWWVANDLALALGYPRQQELTRILDDDEKGLHIVQTLGGDQEMSVISEAGMYHAAFKSRKDVAVRFRKWVTGEVLPEIRRTGRYEMPGFEPAPVQALDLDPTRLSVGVSVVRTAMRLYGPAAARNLWVQVGLPPVIADSEAAVDGDPLAIPLQAFLQGRAATTIAEAAGGMGLHDPDWSTRLRIGKLLALWGWSAKNEKVSRHRTARVFRRPASGVTIEQGADQ